MSRKHLIPFFMVIILIVSILAMAVNVNSIIIIKRPTISSSAPSNIQLNEDSKPYYLGLYDIYEKNVDIITFYIWTGSQWSSTYNGKIINANIKSNDTLEIIPILNMNGQEKIILNATNSAGSTQYNLNITVKPINDPPVIEMIGNIKVSGNDELAIFVYQDDWYNATVIASDVDGDTLVYLDNSSLFDINYLTGNISFKPENKDVGIDYVNITVSDVNKTNYEDWVLVKFTILNVNDPPTATIVEPLNDTEIYSWREVYFEAEANDPDLRFNDVLSYNWYSDIDGHLGSGNGFYSNYLSVGKHIITLNVTDTGDLSATDSITITVKPDYYDQSIYLELDKDRIIAKQNEMVTCQLKVNNWGYSKDNLTFIYTNYYDFTGEVSFEPNYLIIKQQQSKIVNVTITVPKMTKIGIHFIDISAKSSLYDDFNNSYNYKYREGSTVSLGIIVVSNITENDSKQAEKPNWKLGNMWKYKISNNNNYGTLPAMEGTISMTITDDTSVTVEDDSYDAFLMSLDSDIEMKSEYGYNPYGQMDLKMWGDCYYRKSDLAEIQYKLHAEMSANMFGQEMEYNSNISRTIIPPVNAYDFPVKPGETWSIEKRVIEVTETRISSGYGDFYSNEDIKQENSSIICLGTELVKTTAGTFEAYVIMEYDREIEYIYDYGYDYGDDIEPEPKEGVKRDGTRQDFFDSGNEDSYSINYYSPDVGNSIKQINYEREYEYDDYNYTERYVWKESAVIELVSFIYREDDEDKDKDEIPDHWEDKYDVDDPDADDDNDNFTNIEEYQKGTNPKDKNDTPDDPIDNDADDIPDTWERDHGLDPTDSEDAELDFDSDKVSNRDEYEAGTSPFDPDDHPEIIDTDQDKDDSLFGYGKLGNLDLAYLYILIIIIIITILVVVAVMTRNKRKKRLREAQSKTEVEDRVQKRDDHGQIMEFSQKGPEQQQPSQPRQPLQPPEQQPQKPVQPISYQQHGQYGQPDYRPREEDGQYRGGDKPYVYDPSPKPEYRSTQPRQEEPYNSYYPQKQSQPHQQSRQYIPPSSRPQQEYDQYQYNPTQPPPPASPQSHQPSQPTSGWPYYNRSEYRDTDSYSSSDYYSNNRRQRQNKYYNERR